VIDWLGLIKFDDYAGGNWKCNGTKDSIEALVSVLVEHAGVLEQNDVDVLVAPTFLHIPMVKDALQGTKYIVSAQNCWEKKSGAFTGEVSAEMIKDVGLDWVILGHSERRHVITHESDEMIANKVGYALSQGLNVVFCIGETLEEREGGHTNDVCERQIRALLSTVTEKDWLDGRIVVAYEPVWAIGTGKVATPEQAQEVHEHIRKWMASNVSETVAASTRIIYGGSVNASNCNDLAKRPDIDGFLVGGASLKPEFIEIIKAQ
jgi:triosephosphate isomerase